MIYLSVFYIFASQFFTINNKLYFKSNEGLSNERNKKYRPCRWS